MNGFERVIAAGLAGGCIASVAVLAGVGAGGDMQMTAAVLQKPVDWLTWTFGLGAAGGAAIGFLRENRS